MGRVQPWIALYVPDRRRARQNVLERRLDLAGIAAVGHIIERVVTQPGPELRIAVELDNLPGELLRRAPDQYHLAVDEPQLSRGQFGDDGGNAAAHRFN